ncbi:hypothetical protein [Pseudomonas tussilaginis]|uniref:hypothetical protein n=1 Tax=Pseudomonas sp. 5 TaxID=1619949 RepID=UPI0009E1A8C3|nr:hypothetical protein [Pseudomonas sp. 5]
MNECIDHPAKAKATLASLAPNEITNLEPSEKFAVVAMKSGMNRPMEYRRVEIPTPLQSCPLAQCFIKYFNSSRFKENSLHDAYAKHLKFNNLMKWAIAEYPNTAALPPAFLQDFARYLRTDRKLKQNSICGEMSFYRTTLEWYLEEHAGEFRQIETLTRIKEAKAFIPSVPNRSGRTKSLGQITNQNIKDELKIVRSTIRFCCQFLKQMNDHRTQLLNHPEVKQTLDKIISECNGDVEKLRYSSKKSNRSGLYKPLAEAILKSENLQLKERLLHNQYGFRNSQFNDTTLTEIPDTNKLIQAGLTELNFLDIKPGNTHKKLHFHNIDYLFLVKHTPSEEIAFSWLLATDRIQLSGINKMQHGDLRITPVSASPIFIKGRSNQPIREVPMHPKSSIQYRAYCEFDELKKSFLTLFPLSGNTLVNAPVTSNIQCTESIVFRPLIMAACQQTSSYRSLLEADNEIEIFAEIVRRVATNNHPIWNNKKIRRELAAQGGTSPTPVERQTITVTAIAQSRAILDTDGNDPANEAFEKYSQAIVGADATAHSPGVKQAAYINASETKYRLDKRALFASSVGHLMVEDARKVQAAVSKDNLISASKLKTMLGWSKESGDSGELDEFNALLLSAQQLGFSISPFGQLEKNNQTFIIINPITAALMTSYLDECISQLSILSTEDDSKALAIAMQAAHIENVLEKFDHKTVIQGRKILKTHKFPKPIIR